MKTLNVIGCGRVGRTCGRLWAAAGVFSVQDVLTRSVATAADAVTFIGAGRAAPGLSAMRAAEVWMIATRDDAIAASCDALADSGLLRAGDIVFHLSGGTPSGALESAAARGAFAASVHPVKTFTDAAAAARSFAGTFCSAEGDARALAVLKPAFERIGARVFDIAPEFKAIYHSGGVFACNYLVALIEIALRCHEKAGIPREVSLAAIAPMVRETVDAVFARGPAAALTGPVSRGDVTTLGRHLAALAAWDGSIEALYRELGMVAAALAEEDHRAAPEALEKVRRLLGGAER